MADDLQQHSLCLLFTLCVFASTVRFLGNNPAAGTGSGAGGWLVVSHRVTAVIASRKRPVPFRTRKLSSIAPMVLHSGGCGRVGRRRTSSLGVEECLNPRTGCSPPPLPFFMPGSRTSARERFRVRGRGAVMRSRGVREPGGAHEFPGREPASRCHGLTCEPLSRTEEDGRRKPLQRTGAHGRRLTDRTPAAVVRTVDFPVRLREPDDTVRGDGDGRNGHEDS